MQIFLHFIFILSLVFAHHIPTLLAYDYCSSFSAFYFIFFLLFFAYTTVEENFLSNQCSIYLWKDKMRRNFIQLFFKILHFSYNNKPKDRKILETKLFCAFCVCVCMCACMCMFVYVSFNKKKTNFVIKININFWW